MKCCAHFGKELSDVINCWWVSVVSFKISDDNTCEKGEELIQRGKQP